MGGGGGQFMIGVEEGVDSRKESWRRRGTVYDRS